MHRRLAEIVDEPELKARHLAMAATHGDELTLTALDEAADMARSRGAPAAAAELLDLAIGLGGGTPERRILSAAHHFDAGEPARARLLLQDTIERLDGRAPACGGDTPCSLSSRHSTTASTKPPTFSSRPSTMPHDELAQRVAILVVVVVRIGQRGAYAVGGAAHRIRRHQCHRARRPALP